MEVVSEVTRWASEFSEWEANWDQGVSWCAWVGEHTEIPVYCIVIYLAITFQGPEALRERDAYPIRSQFALWNLFLAVFSVIGCAKCAPVLIGAVREHGFTWTTCTDPEEWYLTGPVGLWSTLFVFSKIPELLDTVFLVLQKKRVIFLHWFHHATVLLYCWHSFSVRSATGIWFISMNYFVHSIMYSYYFLMIIGQKTLAKAIARHITTLQLLQMVVGCTVTYHSASLHMQGGKKECYVDPANYKMGLGMYFSYLVLFGMLFYDKYIKPGGGKPKGPGQPSDKLCGVDVSSVTSVQDSAGMFRSSSQADLKPTSAAASKKKKTK